MCEKTYKICVVLWAGEYIKSWTLHIRKREMAQRFKHKNTKVAEKILRELFYNLRVEETFLNITWNIKTIEEKKENV